MSEPDEPEPPADPPKGTPQPVAADSAKLASADVPEGSDTARAFISYASADSSIANAVCSALEREGVKCWIAPRDVTPGELYSGNIVHAIDTTRVVVLVLSQHAADSGHVLREVERASSKRHPIVSFRIDVTPLPDDFAYFLNTSQWLDASATGIDRALPRLVDAVKSALGKTAVTARVAQNPPVKIKAGRRPSHILVPLTVIIATALAYFVADRFWLSERDDPQKALMEATTAAPTDSSGTPTIPAKSIAVLPFVDMSAEKNQEYMADGMAEELLNLLSQVPELKVIARTSSFSFKGQSIEIAEIARKLNVAHVLEGSVRTSGKKLRVTAQLIRAADSTHVWSANYDRPVHDIFTVQDEIAHAVVSQLKLKLLGSPRNAAAKLPDAYALVLKARDLSYEYTAPAFEQAILLYKRALALDPNYAAAWVALANVYCLQAYEDPLKRSERRQLALEATQRALSLDPNYAPALARLAWIAIYLDRNYQSAATSIERALALDPVSTDAMTVASTLSRRLGRHDQAIAFGEYVVARDPLNFDTRTELASSYGYGKRGEAALREFRTALQNSPDAIGGHGWIAEELIGQGRAEEAIAEVRSETDDSWRLYILAFAHHALGHNVESKAAFEELIETYGNLYPNAIALVAAFRGDNDLAFEWLEKAERAGDPSFAIFPIDPLSQKLARDIRWKPYWHERGLAPEQLAAIKFNVTLPQ